MSYTLIKGKFRNIGSPDGDSVWFEPDNPELIYNLPHGWRRPYVRQHQGTIALRYEGIDAPEDEQELTARQRETEKQAFSSNATKKNLELLGIPTKNKRSRGYILTRQIEPYGRPISFAFTCETEKEDGSSICLDVDLLKCSVNFQLVHDGYVYPLFYETLSPDIREAIKSAADKAKCKKLGIWETDKTTVGVTLYKSLRLPYPIQPKLWRRIEKYKEAEGFTQNKDTIHLDGFMNFLIRNYRDRLLIVPQMRFVDFADIVCVNEGENSVRLLYASQDIIFL